MGLTQHTARARANVGADHEHGPKRLLATVALGAALVSTTIGETRAMPIPVTTADAIASPTLTEHVQWRGYGWRG